MSFTVTGEFDKLYNLSVNKLNCIGNVCISFDGEISIHFFVRNKKNEEKRKEKETKKITKKRMKRERK